jgi:hypothetical protein
MKKLDTLKNELEKALADETKTLEIIAQVKQIANNEAVTNRKTLENNEILALLEFAELKKALDNKNYTLVLDINFENYKSEAIQVFTFTLADTHNDRALHLYRNETKSNYAVSFSSKKMTLEKVELFKQNNTDYTVKHKTRKNKKTNAIEIKDTYLNAVNFDNVFNACKTALAILETDIETMKAKIAESEIA